MKNDNYANLKFLKKLSKRKSFLWPLISFVSKREFLLKQYFYVFEKYEWSRRFLKPFEFFFLFYKYAKFSEGMFNQKVHNDQTVLFTFTEPSGSRKNLYALAFSRYLSLKGYGIEYFICDGYLGKVIHERQFKTYAEYPNLYPEYYRGYKLIQKHSSLKFHYLINNSNNEKVDFSAVDQELQQLKMKNQLSTYKFEGMDIGEWALFSTMKFFYVGEKLNTDEFKSKHHELISLGIKFYLQFSNFISQNNFKFGVIHNGSLMHGNIQRFVFVRNNIRYLTYETWLGEGSMIIKANDEVMRLRWDDEYIKFRNNFILDSDKIDQVDKLFMNIKSGKELYARLNEDVETIIEGDYVTLFTNLNFDSAVVGRHTIFDSMNQWIQETVKYWIEENIQTKLVIRIHPGELKLRTISTDFVFENLKQFYKKFDNIIIYKPDEIVNSYSLLANSKFSIVYSSTIGLESLLYGKSIVIAGDPFYRTAPFIKPICSRNEYFDLLNHYLRNDVSLDVDRKELYGYLYYFYISRVFQIQGLKIRNKSLDPDIDVNSLDDFILRNEKFIRASYLELISENSFV